MTYDSAGSITYDGANSYLYDTEGRVCAVSHPLVSGGNSITEYVYDAEGTRVAKGTVPSGILSANLCNPTYSTFSVISSYVVGGGGEDLTEMGPNYVWVIATSSLLANSSLPTPPSTRIRTSP